MTMSEKRKKALRGVITIVTGILAFVLFRWTPSTGNGLLMYGALLAVVIGMAIVLTRYV